MAPRWRIYYGDGSTYSGDPYEAPQTGVQVVVQETQGGRQPFRVMRGKDAYYWKPDSGWHGCDTLGMWDYLFMYRGPKAVLFGRETERDEDFWEVSKRARAEGIG